MTMGFHKGVSFVKSGIRIMGCLLVPICPSVECGVVVFATFMGLAELLGVVEEIKENN